MFDIEWCQDQRMAVLDATVLIEAIKSEAVVMSIGIRSEHTNNLVETLNSNVNEETLFVSDYNIIADAMNSEPVTFHEF